MDSEIAVNGSKQITINTAGLLLLFGWACFVLLNWLASRYLPESSTIAAAIIGAGYLVGVGTLLAWMAIQALKSGRHLTYRSAIGRTTSPIGFWALTAAMGGIGTTLLGAGMFALLRELISR